MLELWNEVTESHNAREPYKPHTGRFIVNIGNGTDPEKYDYAVIMPDTRKVGVILIMHQNKIAAYDLNAFQNGNYSYPLNYKEMDSPEEAYAKFMRWIGKMVKKDERARYYNNRRYHEYAPTTFDENKLNEIRLELKKES